MSLEPGHVLIAGVLYDALNNPQVRAPDGTRLHAHESTSGQHLWHAHADANRPHFHPYDASAVVVREKHRRKVERRGYGAKTLFGSPSTYFVHVYTEWTAR